MAAAFASAVAWGPILPASAHATTALQLSEADAAELIMQSLGLLGIEYRFGGSTPAGGLDCSGFVRHVYKEALGLSLPRRAEEMSTVGEPVSRAQLRPGDLVFFNTMQRPSSHVGLYLGEDRFVHAPSTGNVIRVEPLSARYWAQRFEGGRRISRQNELLAQDRGGLERLIEHRSGARNTPAPSSVPSSVPVAVLRSKELLRRTLTAQSSFHSNY